MLQEINLTHRLQELDPHTVKGQQHYRGEFRRDYARVLHSPAFRRLEGKTQLFPGGESDFFRNRLTHSLEVAQIAKSIGYKIIAENPEMEEHLDIDVCEIAGLIHDLGHPPFGHNGERALNCKMSGVGGFEGNAQSIRIITRLEKKEQGPLIFDENGNDCRLGLNLTALSIASCLKYDKCISRKHEGDLVKGYYESEKEIIDKVKTCITGEKGVKNFKTIECSIMDLADDIAYSTYDLEDAFKAGFLAPYDLMSADENILSQIVAKLAKDGIKATIPKCRQILYDLFSGIWVPAIDNQKRIHPNDPMFAEKTLENHVYVYKYSKAFAANGYLRTKLSSLLIDYHMNGIELTKNKIFPRLSSVGFDKQTKLLVNILKHFAYVSLIDSSMLKVAETRGEEIVHKIFDKLHGDKGDNLLPEDFQELYKSAENKNGGRERIICDFIAGMTDRYALEFYGRLYSDNPQTIFKPF